MKRLICLLMITFLLTSCAPPAGGAVTPASDSAAPADSSQQQEQAEYAISVIFGVGGIKDGAYNELCYNGLKRAESELGIKVTSLETSTEYDYKTNIDRSVEGGAQLVMCVGFSMQEQLENAARANPDKQFVILDGAANEDLPNLTNISFAHWQASYLAGVAAASATKSGVIGFVLGKTGEVSEVMSSFGYGYIAGAVDTNPDIKVLQFGADSFADLPGGKSAALDMASKGADVIFHAAGGTGRGVISGCEQAGIWAIGVDSDQSQFAPAHVLTSAMKRVDNATYSVIEAFVRNGKLPGGNVVYDLSNDGVGLAPTTDNLSRTALENVRQAQRKIISGEIVVPQTRYDFTARYGDIYELY